MFFTVATPVECGTRRLWLKVGDLYDLFKWRRLVLLAYNPLKVKRRLVLGTRKGFLWK